MKATGREITVWFMAHAIWWAVGAFIVYPLFITPLYSTLFSNGASAASRTFYATLIGFGVAVVGWCVALVIFLSTRGPGPNAAAPIENSILGPGR